MEHTFEGVLNQEWHMQDLKWLTSQISEHESLLRLKRRWLMDMALSVGEQKQIEETLPPNDKMLLESLLREDDVSYESIRTCIEKGFGVHHSKSEVNFHRNQMVCSTASEAYHADAEKVLEGLGDFPFRTLLAMHRKLKGVKGYIPSMLPRKDGMGRIKLTGLVKKYSRKMLSDLGKAGEPSEELVGALGIAGLTSKFVMNCSIGREFRIFSPEIESLQNDIAKAIRLLNDPKHVSMLELRKVRRLLDPSFQVSARSLRAAIRNLLTEYLFECSDMDEVPVCILQTVNMINRCSQHSTPKVFSSPGVLKTEFIQNEVEHVLTVSAQAKEVVLSLLPTYEFDKDYTHAYMDDFEESDTLCISDDEQVGDVSWHDEFYCYNTNGQAESIGETNPGELNPSISTSETDDCSFSRNRTLNPSPYMTSEKNLLSQSHTSDSNSLQNEVKCKEATSSGFFCSDILGEEANIMREQNRSGNQYLEVQEACDLSSMIAYRFMGHLLGKLAKVEGIELSQGDSLYLCGHSSVPEDSEGSPNSLFMSEFSELWRSVVQE
ncbi:uncharacterized protein LOC127257896 [Andrographis paniculata]|uniref:uncharacterized protein LOC127257896 n=1 Tax=Andrographis paniculata TaxID=175694 RepID=UPI0021E75200|nr:uncharacterized protein LOC127257896 [Andrographis paniculata]XP_051140378.1 uncharacterized protein LOC127257896 [Andrographis paniculata]XP_051140379.1 uncharacterized protein LOC127257896 [Andrographis paniculata]XP_051140380.1 uncharacterized protein LOC127257896 [Andrographis paniculata]XP_051140381.1 uncharacterized protein LOC127257896 [Andrographis paniculata]XP_051140382.1 uncharacterized protein LOC127257896 [Andrographis paniculata]XP_051140383.1 uncharacterized protein LOC12725